MDRFEQRKAEFLERKPEMDRMAATGEIQIRNGVVFDGKTGQPFTGDYDLYDLTKPDGTLLTHGDGPFEAAMRELNDPVHTIDNQHPPHLNWEPTKDGDIAEKARIINQHRTTEPLYEFRENGEIWEVFAN